ncbi:acylpyruvate hydrolase [Paraburkholderia sp. GAS199]|uniref:fumarylacetoacetate hydrolase family protein n=1 Tax=Paraburkholderia sp. GAS199 TaxID=3035126 RepID=UPI003D253B5B
MRFISYRRDNTSGIAVGLVDGTYRGLDQTDDGFPGRLSQLLRAGSDALSEAARSLASSGRIVDPARHTVMPPITAPGKIVRVSPSYPDQSREAGCEKPACAKLSILSCLNLIGPNTPLRPARGNARVGYEGELVVVMGRAGKCIASNFALSYVAGYTIFGNLGLRDRQDSSPGQKTPHPFDGDGAMGPALVTVDEIPDGAAGLRILTSMNGMALHDVNTNDLAFNVPSAVSLVSTAMVLAPGDLIVLGRACPSVVTRLPTRAPKLGDVCEVEIERIGILRNAIGAHQPL